MKKITPRRKFLQTSALLVSGTVLVGRKAFGAPAYIPGLLSRDARINGVQVGAITYSFRSMPDQSAEATLQYILDAGITAVELMGGPAEIFAGAPQSAYDFSKLFPLMRKRNNKEELTEEEQKMLKEGEQARQAYRKEMAAWRGSVSMKKFEDLRRMYNDAGVQIYAFKPDAFGNQNTDAEITYGMRAGKLLGASQVTLEHPGNDDRTLKLGRMAEKIGIKVAYHGHEQQTPTFWDTALAQSPANAINMDLGHFVAAGNPDPLSFIRDKHERIASMHIKDRQTPAHGKGNLSWGQGDTPIVQALQLMRDQKYTFPATIEFEYTAPEGSDAVNEVRKCLEYCKAALA